MIAEQFIGGFKGDWEKVPSGQNQELKRKLLEEVEVRIAGPEEASGAREKRGYVTAFEKFWVACTKHTKHTHIQTRFRSCLTERET
jgi:hypothetical protein